MLMLILILPIRNAYVWFWLLILLRHGYQAIAGCVVWILFGPVKALPSKKEIKKPQSHSHLFDDKNKSPCFLEDVEEKGHITNNYKVI